MDAIITRNTKSEVRKGKNNQHYSSVILSIIRSITGSGDIIEESGLDIENAHKACAGRLRIVLDNPIDRSLWSSRLRELVADEESSVMEITEYNVAKRPYVKIKACGRGTLRRARRIWTILVYLPTIQDPRIMVIRRL